MFRSLVFPSFLVQLQVIPEFQAGGAAWPEPGLVQDSVKQAIEKYKSL